MALGNVDNDQATTMFDTVSTFLNMSFIICDPIRKPTTASANNQNNDIKQTLKSITVLHKPKCSHLRPTHILDFCTGATDDDRQNG